ncbi:hypothetical protein [Formosa maritima]|uniref:Uncharacterized protein n=1 Tax=Formosa maritima TaxID=2592046 RepID=A0A5D0GGX4_9FLAO|nr:hypothetical protein [Formosa maritima]TYA58265.1 hypothetical protein FVF61_03560 [Formosa maritima]
MNKRSLVFVNFVLFIIVCLLVVNCKSNWKTHHTSGYVNEVDTLYEERSNKILSIDRTFYRKLPTVHNGVIEFKQTKGETYVIVVINDVKAEGFAMFVIEDFKEFIKNANHIMSNMDLDITVNVDDLKSTSMRKSISFKKGVFLSKEANNTKSTIFDLSEETINQIQEAYFKYLNE